MKRLLLVRHAKSSWKDFGLVDFERPLNKRGEHDAPMMAGRLVRKEILPDLIVASSAKRAKRTAQLFCRVMKIPETQLVYDERIYEAGAATLLQVIRSFGDDWGQVMMVGHNPGITSLANALAGSVSDNIPTCGVVDLSLDVGRWCDVLPGCGICRLYDYPKRVQ